MFAKINTTRETITSNRIATVICEDGTTKVFRSKAGADVQNARKWIEKNGYTFTKGF